MVVRFYDRQEEDNSLNGEDISKLGSLSEFLSKLQEKPAFFCELIGQSNKLLVGLGRVRSCAQFSGIAGEPPYLMAVGSAGDLDGDELEFLINDTATPVPFRYSLLNQEIINVIDSFVDSEKRSPLVSWEEI